MQKSLIIIGLVIVVIGFAWPWISSLPLGRLPGDIVIKRDNFTFFMPITTMLLVSIVVSLLIWLVQK